MLKNLKKLQRNIFNFSSHRETSDAEMEVCFRLINFASQGNVKALEEELKKGTDMNSSDYDLRTTFHIAASTGQEAVVKFFLDNKIPPISDRFGAFP